MIEDLDLLEFHIAVLQHYVIVLLYSQLQTISSDNLTLTNINLSMDLCDCQFLKLLNIQEKPKESPQCQ